MSVRRAVGLSYRREPIIPIGFVYRMELQQLRYFCAVARTGSFTKAAEQEEVAQPSLSQQIHKLEAGIGAPLFERLGRGVKLTKNGQALLPRALTILREVSAANAKMNDLLQGTSGELRVGCIPTIMPFFLAPRLPEFIGRYPQVKVRLLEDTTVRLVERLQAGSLDVAVAALPIRNEDIVCSELFREELLLAVSQEHPMANLPTVSLTQLKHERVLLLKEGHCFRDSVLTACHRARLELESAFESDQFASIFPLVASGYGVSLIPAMAIGHATHCRIVKLDRPASRRIGYIHAGRHFVDKPHKAFTAWLRECAGPMRKPA